ncbi:MAG: cytochrome c-type biogenesis protein CcmH [Ardenticatenaceae bacterium]|nr:cytochrome c-type biogenesis protein CcmH [Ardenticatenaceae bacterium]MCB9443678.1 cytochrome c-type biogenesis protein CcmH [Ardenticatenaceae bacterium]
MKRFSQHNSNITFYTIILLVILAFVIPVMAQDGGSDSGTVKRVVTDDDVNKIARVVYCPVCESTPLDVCQTQACADWRQIIREMLEEGKSEQDVFDYFSNLYGDRVLAEPPREGFSLLIWLVPLIMVPVGLVFFGSYMRHLRASAGQSETVESTAVSEPAAPDDYITQIEKELQQK